MNLNPDSFSTKIILNGIDKLAFTLLLMLILFYVSHNQGSYERAQMRAELNSMKIQKPIELLEQLSDSIRRCTLLTRRGSRHPLLEEEEEKLASLLLDIKLKLEMIKSYSKDREEAREITMELQRTVESALAKPDITDNDLEELTETLHNKFAHLFERMIGETTKIITVDGGLLDKYRIILH